MLFGKGRGGNKKPSSTKKRKLSEVRPKRATRETKAHDETVAGNNTVLLSKAALLGRVAAWTLVAVVIAGSVFGFLAYTKPPAEASPVAEKGLDSSEQQAGDYAKNFVASWLRATKTDSAGLETFRNIGQGEVTQKQPTEFRDLSTASIETGANGISTVIISAALRVPGEPSADASQKPADKWETTWFQVNVAQGNGQFSVLQWPTPVAAPTAGQQVQTGYKYEGSAEINSTVDSFLQAYILNDGDVSRLVSPETKINPLGANPFKTVTVTKVMTDSDFRDEVPKDGTTARALATGALGESATENRVVNYALSLETRGGRWEVTAIDPAPLLAASTTSSATASVQPSASQN